MKEANEDHESLAPSTHSTTWSASTLRILTILTGCLTLLLVFSSCFMIWSIIALRRTNNDSRSRNDTRVSARPAVSVHGLRVAAVAEDDDRKFTFDDAFTLRPKGSDAQWRSWQGEDYLVSRSGGGGEIRRKNLETGEAEPMIPADCQEQFGNWTRYFVFASRDSGNRTYVLLARDVAKVWRHSFEARYVAVHVAGGAPSCENMTVYPVPYDGGAGALDGPKLRMVLPAEANSHQLVYVSGNNLYHQASPHSEPVQVTRDGHSIDLFNGVSDWLYEEDVLGTYVATYWSANSSYVAFGKFNASLVERVSFPVYGTPADLYDRIETIAYPKAGGNVHAPPENTQVSLHVFHRNAPTVLTSLESPFPGEDHYYTAAQWVDDHVLYVHWTNRIQNVSRSCYYRMQDDGNATCSKTWSLEVPDGWIERPARVEFVDGEEHAVFIHPFELQNETGTWNILALWSSGSGEDPCPLQDEPDEVTEVVGYDPDTQFLYFISTRMNAINRQLQKVRLDLNLEPMTSPDAQTTSPDAQTNSASALLPLPAEIVGLGALRVARNSCPKAEKSNVICLSCNWQDTCTYVSASMSPSRRRYILRCHGPDIPTYRVYSVSEEDEDKLLEDLEDNEDFREKISGKEIVLPKKFTIPIADGLFDAPAEISIPEACEKNRCPLLFYVYGGPASQRVVNRYPIGGNINGWLMYLKSSMNVIVVSMDGRGTPYSGNAWKYQMYKKMGTVELDDQHTALKEVLAMYGHQIDGDEPQAIFGWSYGGQTSSLMLNRKDDEHFRCALAVAPSTSKYFYDTAYTERYMGFAYENIEAYDKTVCMNYTDNFAGKKYFLAHGTQDDNVHFNHAAHMAQKLTWEEFQFRFQMYVDQDHSINGHHEARHLFRAMTYFLFGDCYQKSLGDRPPVIAGQARLVASPAILVALVAVLAQTLQM